MHSLLNPCFGIAGINADSKKADYVKKVMQRCICNTLEYVSVFVKREPDNIYDPYAIAVFLNDFQIGYIKKEDNRYFDSLKPEYILPASIINWGLQNGAVYVVIQTSITCDNS